VPIKPTKYNTGKKMLCAITSFWLWDGKGERDRTAVLLDSPVPALQTHQEDARALHRQDLREGFGEVSLPCPLAPKYPNAQREWPQQNVFSASQRSADALSGKIKRPLLGENVL
jgi:hypothetical protein